MALGRLLTSKRISVVLGGILGVCVAFGRLMVPMRVFGSVWIISWASLGIFLWHIGDLLGHSSKCSIYP